MRRLRTVLVSSALVAAGFGFSPPAPAAAASVTNGCVASVPEPGTTEPVEICYTLFQPASASAESPVPMVLHSHGWGGSRTSTPTAFPEWMDAGFGVLSFDQRGFGASGGQAHVQDPDLEGQDVQRLVDLVAGLDWVALDGPGDPVLGAIGGSYGGGYQYVGALSEIRDRGATRFDALAPEITWWDVKESLAPAEVVRTAWVTALYGAGLAAHTETVHRGFAYGAATGEWPKGGLAGADLDAFFAKNGPAWHAADGRLLDIPVLIGQGVNDNLFNLNQGLKTFAGALTPAARARSIFVGYNGGHALPSALPAGAAGSGDPCSNQLTGGRFADLALRFFQEELLGQDTGLGGRGLHHISTTGGRCVTSASVDPTATVPVGDLRLTTGAGAPMFAEVAAGPISVSGMSYVDATVSTLGLDNRAFFALAVGRTPLDARIVQNNMLPLREATAVSGVARTVELPAVAVDVAAGEKLFLAVSPLSDMSFGHGNRVPGVLQLSNVSVRLPVVPGA